MVLDARALKQSVQEFPPPNALPAGAFFGITERGWYLPQYGVRERDRVLRSYDRDQDNSLWQGALAGFLKKVAATPWEVTGKGTVTVDQGRGPQSVDAVGYYQELIQNAHFGQGWKYFLMRGGRDYYTQDFGWICEVIGPGDPNTPLMGAPTGIAVLDSLRCFTTGNPTYPILYFSNVTGKMHRLHYTRVARFVDMPDGDERFYGSGLCALSRYISIAQQQIYMSRYLVQSLDDKPKPGLMVASNIAKGQVEAMLDDYMRQQSVDELLPWGKTFWFYSIDPTAPAKLEPVNFAVPPEKFDYKTYMDIHVNALALALGVDKQELWELGGHSIGSGAQSEVLAQKARGKAFGDFLTTIERFVNTQILPDADTPGAQADVTFAFKYKDDEEEKAQIERDSALIAMAETMQRMGFNSQLIANLLADRSETFREVLTNSAGQVVGTDIADRTQVETTAADNAPQGQAEQPKVGAPAEKPMLPATTASTKDYAVTRAEFTTQLADLIHGGLADDVNRRRFGIVMRAQLRRLGQMAYEDGLKAGGVVGEIDDNDTARIQDWLGEQSAYVSGFADTLYKEGLASDEVTKRAELWANKSLELMYQEGLKSADANASYKWLLGSAEEHCETCKRLAGQVHRLSAWYSKGLLPKRDKLDCGGWQCKCQLMRTAEPAVGRF